MKVKIYMLVFEFGILRCLIFKLCSVFFVILIYVEFYRNVIVFFKVKGRLDFDMFGFLLRVVII